ncbi:MAG: Gfo/Idh/MocA family oxidoreductase [Candidatus Latescibacteria bacterium]|jgi:predicted dehydrogenase|nr:Gfo/Idh/MocA family oxidoreductase [Candidatus Latescibacterota bacterium]
MSKNDTLRAAVIGGGHIAQLHLAVLRDLPGVDVCALVDRDPKALEETGDRFEIPTRLGDCADLLEGERPDAAFVLVSVPEVAAVAGAFLAAGIPTFLEKPPGLYTSQTRGLAELARRHNTPAMVGVNRRFYSNLSSGRELLLEAGPIQSVTVEAHEDLNRVRINPKFPDEVLRRWSAANGIHALDLLRFYGGDIADIAATQHTVEGPMPDCCSAVLRFEGGAMGRALMDWYAPGGHRVEARSVGATFTSALGAAATLRRCGEEPETLEWDEIDRQYKPGFYRQHETFVRCVREDRSFPYPACTLDDAVKTMEMIDAISGTGGC